MKPRNRILLLAAVLALLAGLGGLRHGNRELAARLASPAAEGRR